MVLEQSTQVAELELSVARLAQREKRLRAVLSSSFTSRENRRDAREELEVLLDKSVAADDELLLLGLHDGKAAPDPVASEEQADSSHRPRSLLRRRFKGLGRIVRTGSPA
jgi:hypothetical protein